MNTPDTGTTLNLDAIEARLKKFVGFLPTSDIHALVAEVRRLREGFARVEAARQCDDEFDCECACCESFRAALRGEQPRATADLSDEQ